MIIVFRKLLPCIEWDMVCAENKDGTNWALTLLKGQKFVKTIGNQDELVGVLQEANALGCNISKWRYLYKEVM